MVVGRAYSGAEAEALLTRWMLKRLRAGDRYVSRCGVARRWETDEEPDAAEAKGDAAIASVSATTDAAPTAPERAKMTEEPAQAVGEAAETSVTGCKGESLEALAEGEQGEGASETVAGLERANTTEDCSTLEVGPITWGSDAPEEGRHLPTRKWVRASRRAWEVAGKALPHTQRMWVGVGHSLL